MVERERRDRRVQCPTRAWAVEALKLALETGDRRRQLAAAPGPTFMSTHDRCEGQEHPPSSRQNAWLCRTPGPANRTGRGRRQEVQPSAARRMKIDRSFSGDDHHRRRGGRARSTSAVATRRKTPRARGRRRYRRTVSGTLDPDDPIRGRNRPRPSATTSRAVRPLHHQFDPAAVSAIEPPSVSPPTAPCGSRRGST